MSAHCRCTRLAALAALALLATPGGAHAAATPPLPADSTVPLGQLVQVGGGPVDPAVRVQSCNELHGGTAGAREPGPAPETDTGNGLAPGDATDAPASLPAVVPFKTGTETFNRRYWFAVRGGRVWFRSNRQVTGIDQPWRELPVPPCIYGRVSAVQADDDEMIVLDDARRVYTMDHALRDWSLFDWTSRWGPLFWAGDGRSLPAGSLAWAWSVISPREDGTWTDTAGNAHAGGADKVSHIWMLRDAGQRLEFTDPWLARDDSYEACGPLRGRFRAVDLAASGSTLFVIGAHGDLFTRLYDFDISGSDPAFFTYSYAPQRGLSNPAIQLPSPPWVRQPKIPGRITSTISVEKVGTGALHRTLRVEGLDAAGRTGYWEKDILARSWTFHPTGLALTGRQLDNPRRDTAALGPHSASTCATSATRACSRAGVPIRRGAGAARCATSTSPAHRRTSRSAWARARAFS